MDEAPEAGGRVLSEESPINLAGDQRERPGNKPVSRRSLAKLSPLPRFWSIGRAERENILDALRRPLSGYIGGNSRAGYWISRLSDEWSDTFDCRYSIPCNSATSGLLAACLAAGIEEGDDVWVSTYTMSATASCALLLGANVKFLDIDDTYFTITDTVHKPFPKALIVTNLFGHPAQLNYLREFCDRHKIILIEDNAQAPFATVNGKFAGTIGHIGVFSLNVHKHLQTGEGGVIVTDDPSLAHKVDCAINHGELMMTSPNLGLNLRMTEPIAAIASAQLKKGSQLVQSRINLAQAITDCFDGIDFVEPPRQRPGCVHVYYMWAGKIKSKELRDGFVGRLRARNVPFRVGYSTPLHRLFDPPDFEHLYPVTAEIEDQQIFTFEICAHDPKQHHLKQIKQIIWQEAERIK